MKLTERELDVLACVLIGGKSYQSMAEILKIHKSTVGTHVRKVLVKTGCDTTLDLMNYLRIGDLENRYKDLVDISNTPSKCKELTYFFIAFLFFFMIFFTSKMLG